MSFESPQAFLLAIPLALLAWKLGRVAGPAGWLRWTLVAVVSLALARPVLSHGGDSLDVVVLVDRSRSMPPGAQSAAEELIGHVEAKRGPGQRVGIVGFGREPRVERAPSEEARFGGFQHAVDGEASDLAAALAAADPLVAPDRAGRVLVISDGLATGGDAEAAARRLAVRGIPIDFRLLERRDSEADAAVVDVEVPSSPAAGETFHVSARVRATRAADAGYVLTRNGVEIARGKVHLEPGEQRLLFRDRLDKPGLADYRLALEGARDAVPENDAGRAVARVAGPPRVLLMRPDGRPGALAAALTASGLKVEVIAPTFASLDALSGVSAVVLEDVPAQALGDAAMRALDLFVRERGGGLLMTGGRTSFGQGGYFRSQLEELLPVSMEVRREHRRSPIALAIAMDRSGSMSAMTSDGRPKMALAAEGAAGALTLLSDGDEAAVWVVDERAHEIVPLTPVEKGLDLGRVASVTSQGGGIYIYEALETAALQLEQSNLPVRHLLLFADAADSEEPGQYQQLLADLAKRKVTVSVIGLGSPTDTDAPLLEDIAHRGDGRIYFADSAEALPRLFAQETLAVAQSSFVEEPSGLAVSGDLAMLGAAQPELLAPPQVGGYNLTYLRPGAGLAYRTADDNAAPALALWQRGVGRVAAQPVEVDGPGAARLLAWPGYRALFSKLVRWLMPPPEGTDAVVKVRRDGHELKVVVEVDPSAEQFSGHPMVTLLPGESGAPQQQPLRFEGEGRLSARFSLGASGSFHPVVRLGSRLVQGAPVTLPYAPEFEPQPAGRGRQLLASIAALTGGVERLSVDGLFTRAGEAPGRTELAPILVALALALMVLEVAARRLLVRWRTTAVSTGARPPLGREARAEAGPASSRENASAPEPAAAPAGDVAQPTAEPPAGDVSAALAAARARSKNRLKR